MKMKVEISSNYWTAFAVAAMFIFGFAGAVSAQDVDFNAMLNRIDELTNFKKGDFTATLSMVSHDPEAGTKVSKVTHFRRDEQNKFLVLIQEPEAERGQGTLQVDNNVWAYDPQSRQFTHSSLKDSFAGDTHNSDFKKSSYFEDYTVTSGMEGKLGNFGCWILTMKGNNDEVTYSSEKMWVSKDTRLPMKVEGYSLTGVLLRTTYTYSWTKVDDKFYPTKVLYIDALTKSKYTEVTLTNMSRENLPDDVYTKAFLERVSH